MWLLVAVSLLSAVSSVPQNASSAPLICPEQCICLSPAQVLCNNGGLYDVPVMAVSPSITFLSLSKNHFSVIRTESFTGLRALERLTMDHNTIDSLKPFAFRGLPRLKELSIQHTTLDAIEQFTFAGLQNITSISLAHNRIKRIEGYAFAGTTNIKHLRLNNNPVQIIESHAFSGLTNVEHVHFPSGIKTLQPDAFNGMAHVFSLRLAFMDLSTVPRFAFRGLLHVRTLSIQESDLGVVERGAFEGLGHVRVLNMHNNKIDAMREFNVSRNNSVHAVRFHGNHVLENPEPRAVVVEGVERASVTQNHLPCDCRARAIAAGPLGNATGGELLDRNFCIAPLEARGRRMREYFDATRALAAACDERLRAAAAGDAGQTDGPGSGGGSVHSVVVVACAMAWAALLPQLLS